MAAGMAEKTKAPDGETIKQLEALLADMKKAAAAPPEKQGDTYTDAKAKEPKPAKELKINKNNWWNTNRVIMYLFYK
ncbi:hypothetical protein B0H14DRAFT_3540052 [Mycena olivaceomarginata]|nr:hypothetical protein B0H14DRAFT_3540052 [Mycena olivaceomarginata]